MSVGSINLERPELILESKNFDLLIQLWLEDRSLQVEPLTYKNYHYKIGYFRHWWDFYGPLQEWQLHRGDFLRFREHLESYALPGVKPLAHHTQKDILRRLRQVLLFANREGYTDGRDYAAWVPEARGSADLRAAATAEAIAKLIEAARNQDCAPENNGMIERDLAMIAVLLGTGMRRGECASLNLEDIHIDADGSGTAIIRKAKRVKHRDIQQRAVAFDEFTGHYLCAWLDCHQETHGPVFVAFSDDDRGKRLSAQGVYKAINRHVMAAGVKAEIKRPCHDLRVAFATYWERNRKGQAYDHLLSKQLGHASYRMTTAYSRLDVEDVRDEFISPMERHPEGTRE